MQDFWVWHHNITLNAMWAYLSPQSPIHLEFLGSNDAMSFATCIPIQVVGFDIIVKRRKVQTPLFDNFKVEKLYSTTEWKLSILGAWMN